VYSRIGPQVAPVGSLFARRHELQVAFVDTVVHDAAHVDGVEPDAKQSS
jgi:hypothetical protein